MLKAEPAAMDEPQMVGYMPNVALVSMPWQSAWMPSIQLSVLRECLAGRATVETFEFYVDYAARISPSLYRRLSEAGGIIEEWAFAERYFRNEGIVPPSGFLDEFPSFGLPRESERAVVAALPDVSADFVAELADATDWSAFDVVAFTLTIYQTAPSMALAQQIRRRHPDVRIVFGGNSCAGPAARAILRICPHVDAVVRGEAEAVFADLVARLAASEPLDTCSGLTYRGPSGEIHETEASELQSVHRVAARPDFDAFFERFDQSGIGHAERIWLPFESSRGCWWGEHSQCTFCGLHESMEYRYRDADEVLDELDYLYSRYGIGRFFSTDLIMPAAYYETLVPELIRNPRGYEFFYELKPNLTRRRLAMLAAAGITNVQPGLESLSTSVLRLMNKGQKGTQNIQFLRWAREYGVSAKWNYIVGMPTEQPSEHERIALGLRWLHHLEAPFLIKFEMNRFSPIFADPAAYGIDNLRPLYIYRYVFPVNGDVLADLVYRFEYDSQDFEGTPPWLVDSEDEYLPDLEQHFEDWRIAYEAGASFIQHAQPDGTLHLADRRELGTTVETFLAAEEAALYEYLDSMRRIDGLGTHFERRNPDVSGALGGPLGIDERVSVWIETGLAFAEGGFVVALATADAPRLTVGPGDLDGSTPVTIGRRRPARVDDGPEVVVSVAQRA